MAAVFRKGCVLLLLLLLTFLALSGRLHAAREEPAGTITTTQVDDKDVVHPQALCGYKSKTYSGTCTRTKGCDNQCRGSEHVVAGACHWHHLKRVCYCYTYC